MLHQDPLALKMRTTPNNKPVLRQPRLRMIGWVANGPVDLPHDYKENHVFTLALPEAEGGGEQVQGRPCCGEPWKHGNIK